MYTVYVKHYLNDEGINYFNQTWFPRVKDAISIQPGFISINAEIDNQNKSCANILLKFKTQDDLKSWAKTEIHDNLIDLLDPYRIRDFEVATIQTSGNAKSTERPVYKTVIPRNIYYDRSTTI